MSSETPSRFEVFGERVSHRDELRDRLVSALAERYGAFDPSGDDLDSTRGDWNTVVAEVILPIVTRTDRRPRGWVRASDEALLAEETAKLIATELISEAMYQRRVTTGALASRLRLTTRSLTRTLSGAKPLDVGKLARILLALDFRLSLSMEDVDEAVPEVPGPES